MAFTHNIKTSHDNPPIPTRDHDWSAWFDWASADDDHYISGNGETEQAAVADLIAKAAEADEPRYNGEVVDMAFAFWGAPKWQPIETEHAVETGTTALVFVWGVLMLTATYFTGKWMSRGEEVFPSHWMPLPDAPKEGEI